MGTPRVRRTAGTLRCPGVMAGTLAVLLLCSAEDCPDRPIVARVSTRVETDGTIEREVRLAGSTTDEKEPLDAAWWRDRANVDLPARARWQRIEEGPGWILARGRFGDASAVPAPIGHLLPGREVADRDALTLERRDLVLATHFVYREEYGDPFDETARAGALDGAAGAARQVLDDALRHQFGAGVDLSAVDAFVDRYLRALAAEARRLGDTDLPDASYRALGLPPLPDSLPVDAEGKAITGPEEWWLYERLAERLATRGTPATAYDVQRGIGAWAAEHGAAGTEGLTDLLTVYLWGVYGEPSRSTTIRFEWRLALPGRLLRTNGVPDGDGAAWSFPDVRLAAEDRLMTAEALLLRREPLRALGARTRYDAAELDRLAELLAAATADPKRRAALQRAVDTGRIEELRLAPPPPDTLDEASRAALKALADLLDPSTPPLPGP